MKKTPCSIGQYVLKNVEQTRGEEGYGYYAELWKGKKQIGTLEDYGDGGGVNPRFKITNNPEERAAIEQEVFADMKELLSLCGISKNCLALSWINTPYGAMEGFGELLLELTELVKQDKRMSKKANGGSYAVFQTGDHWFLEFGDDYAPTSFFSVLLATAPKKDFDKILKKVITTQLQKHQQKVVMLRYVENGKADWSLSLKEFATLVENAKRVRELK